MEAMLKHAQDVLRMEAEAVLELVPRVDESFASAVQMILDCSGRTVITGMGKSGRRWRYLDRQESARCALRP